jgi:uncharacterized protein YjbJ (UPF0337 family)
MLNENEVKGKWTEFKGELQKMWGKITSDEYEQMKGDVKAIRGLIQQRYGQAQEDYTQKFDDLASKFGHSRDETASKIKEDLKN